MTQFCPEQNKFLFLNSIKFVFNKEIMHALRYTYFFYFQINAEIMLGTLHGYEIYPEDNKLMNTYQTVERSAMHFHLCHTESYSNIFHVLKMAIT